MSLLRLYLRAASGLKTRPRLDPKLHQSNPRRRSLYSTSASLPIDDVAHLGQAESLLERETTLVGRPQPEHAVISTFDLFSIGGANLKPSNFLQRVSINLLHCSGSE